MGPITPARLAGFLWIPQKRYPEAGMGKVPDNDTVAVMLSDLPFRRLSTCDSVEYTINGRWTG